MEFMEKIAVIYVFIFAVFTTVIGYSNLVSMFVKWLWKKTHKAKVSEQEQE